MVGAKSSAAEKSSRCLTFFVSPLFIVFRLLQGWRTRSGTAHRRALPLWNGNWWQPNPFSRTFSNLFPITARRLRNESTRHDSRPVARLRSDNARRASNVQSSDYFLAQLGPCDLQLVAQRARSRPQTNCKINLESISRLKWLIAFR